MLTKILLVNASYHSCIAYGNQFYFVQPITVKDCLRTMPCKTSPLSLTENWQLQCTGTTQCVSKKSPINISTVMNFRGRFDPVHNTPSGERKNIYIYFESAHNFPDCLQASSVVTQPMGLEFIKGT